jgi:nitrite reductase/ring-hydroxylating ferredoxin subunit
MEWAPVGLSGDLGPGQVMAATVVGAELAVWRAVSGRVSAWVDRCPHRGMRLSHGFVRGETLACLYHGWTYDLGGHCRRIPAHPALVPPAAIAVPGYEVVEAAGVIWVAARGTAGSPPDLPRWRGLRSLPFDATPEQLAAACPGAEPLGLGILRAGDLCLVLQPRPGRLMVHALTQGGDPVAQSRWLEALRLRVEMAT